MTKGLFAEFEIYLGSTDFNSEDNRNYINKLHADYGTDYKWAEDDHTLFIYYDAEKVLSSESDFHHLVIVKSPKFSELKNGPFNLDNYDGYRYNEQAVPVITGISNAYKSMIT